MKRLGITLLVVFVVVFIGVCAYFLGEDILQHFPLWLIRVSLGALWWTIATIIILIFVLGIVKINDICKG